MQVTNRKEFKGRAKVLRSLRMFMTRLSASKKKNKKPFVEQMSQEVWKEIDCLQCANCCKTMSPTYTEEDIKRISSYLNMAASDFKEAYLYYDPKEKDWMNTKQPCQFLNLENNKCNIYDVRPDDCKQFPHHHKWPLAWYDHAHKQNIDYCPATFYWVKKMKDAQWI